MATTIVDPRDAAARARTGLASAEIDAIRGFFILLVVIGHNVVLTSAIPGLFAALYGFHVYAFLFLPFLFPRETISARWAADRAVRYLVPHTFFFLLAALLFWLVFRRGDPTLEVGTDVALAFLLSTARAYKDACGYSLFWFLPALLSLVLARGLWVRLPAAARWSIGAMLVAAHGVIGGLPREVKQTTPLALLIVAQVFPLALLVEWLWSRARHARAIAAVAALGAFALGLSIFAAIGAEARIGSLKLYTWREPGLLLLSSLLPIAALVGFAAASASLARIPWLVALGRSSLVIYLSHSLLFRGLLMVMPPAWLAGSTGAGFALGTLLLGATLAGAWAVARAIEGVPALRRLVTPRGVADWPPTAGQG